ncbi:MAG: hypothetical protein LBI74_00510 [Synergistaceae bacterium]|nr:hypothetical protein [Synergistaceae bacterium]
MFSALSFAAIVLIIGVAVDAAYSSSMGARGDDGWVGETRRVLAEMTGPRERTGGEIGADQIISLGVPAYNHLLDRVSEESSYALTFFADGMPLIITGELSKVVPFGGVTLEFDDFRSSGYAKGMIAKASGFLPTRWLKWIVCLNRERKLTAEIASRGEYHRGRIRTNNLRISLHELVHAYEDKPFASLENKLRSEFYERRTSGKKLRRLRGITNLYFYGPKEKFKAGFVYRYIGKDRGVELMSMGIESLMWNRFDIWNRDPELTKFLLGMLIFFGRNTNSADSAVSSFKNPPYLRSDFSG